ncbi:MULTISPECIES: hypothetical protein [Nostocales]|uniref:Uncharacterized protein n=1 Tax=Scytonema hofmannii FACHB-248 TaxID=1842502 RepID=A0ABR8H277_9CYAN|nr:MULTISPECIES: hypothetical protein [Nostocales]MBD2609351.1 hypothetical protein [Scytonema hofmannii FACHB-248]
MKTSINQPINSCTQLENICAIAPSFSCNSDDGEPQLHRKNIEGRREKCPESALCSTFINLELKLAP